VLFSTVIGPKQAGKVMARLAVLANDVKQRRSPHPAPRNDALSYRCQLDIDCCAQHEFL